MNEHAWSLVCVQLCVDASKEKSTEEPISCGLVGETSFKDDCADRSSTVQPSFALVHSIWTYFKVKYPWHTCLCECNKLKTNRIDFHMYFTNTSNHKETSRTYNSLRFFLTWLKYNDDSCRSWKKLCRLLPRKSMGIHLYK